MLFTRLGKAISWLALILGVTRIVMGFGLAFAVSDRAQNADFARRYLATANTGEAINQGAYIILFAVLLGVLCEISSHLYAAAK